MPLGHAVEIIVSQCMEMEQCGNEEVIRGTGDLASSSS